ncbi:hypothetical protein [uncultured Jannaschia sp.]|uniref:hypothetical protein n=1 Tax=uncultured Jannaschia sp. TaxID=293347 RepID=UPI00261E98CB|nr:hypothetical protein [uncultured Jannaschia sp.]
MRLATTTLCLTILSANAAPAQETSNLWLMWERSGIPDRACLLSGRLDCPSLEEFRSHFLLQVPPVAADELFRSLAGSAAHYRSADIRHDRLPICMETLEAETGPAEMATPVQTLKGLDGVHADFRGIRGPAGYMGDFGSETQNFMLQAFAEAGIPLFDKEEIEAVPGRPTLSIRFAPEVSGCKPWSVSLSLSQTVVLDRDHGKALTAGTWSAASGQDEANVEFGAADAVKTVIAAFVVAWQEANGPAPALR